MKFKIPKIKLPRSAPMILTVISSIGVIATGVITAHCVPKAQNRIDKVKEERNEELTKTDKFLVAAPAYLPAAGVAAATIACMFSSTILSKKQQAALISAYGLLDQSYKTYKNKVNELYGSDATLKIQDAIAEDKRRQREVIYEEHDPDACLFYDEYSDKFFWRSMLQVKEAEYNLNKLFATADYADLNDFYSYLGLECTPFGASVGWSGDSGYVVYGYNWIDFIHEYIEPEDEDAPPYYIIRFLSPPRPDYMFPGYDHYGVYPEALDDLQA